VGRSQQAQIVIVVKGFDRSETLDLHGDGTALTGRRGCLGGPGPPKQPPNSPQHRISGISTTRSRS
jgi:hypothetical protein